MAIKDKRFRNKESSPDQTPMTFGKHTGKTPEEISLEDPSYVVWLHDKTDTGISRALYLSCVDEAEEMTGMGQY